MKEYSVEALCQMIDHTNLHADATHQDLARTCLEATSYQFKMVAINPFAVKECVAMLKGTAVRVGAAIGFPLGQTPIAVKLYETQMAIQDGADEIDYVINIGQLKDQQWSFIEKEMRQIVECCKSNQVISKVILETCYLKDKEIIAVCEIAKRVKPDFVKTSTGFGPAGATIDHVLLMKSVVGQDIGIKAAGGIRDLKMFLAMIDAGASRIGTSSGITIIEQFKKMEI